jgi:predicted permease
MDAAIGELHRSLRALRSSRGLNATIVAVLALGIAANCALFAVINSALLRPLPYDSPERLVEIIQPPRWFILEHVRTARSLSDAAAFIARGLSVPSGDGVRNVFGFLVTPNLFTVLGIEAALGRTFLPGEDTQPVVILGYDYWRRISGDPNIIGQVLTIADEKRTVVGVLPADFSLQVRDGNLFVPARISEGRIVARLRPRASVSAADTEMKAIVAASPSTGGQALRGARTGAEPLTQAFRSNDALILLYLQAAAVLVLLITCANIANILLVRANARRREFGIRAAMGAARGQILRQLMFENALLSTLGAILGLALAHWSSSWIAAQLPANIARRLRGAEALAIDHRVLLFTLGASVLTVLVFGLAPALAAMRVDVVASLRATATGEGRERRRYGQLLVIAEIALTVTLLIAAGLTLKSLVGLQNQKLGFSPDHVLRTAVDLPRSRYPNAQQRLQTLHGILERLEAIPGVTEVGLVAPQLFPFGGPRVGGVELEIRGSAESGARAEVYYASTDYFRSVRLPLLRGRFFTDADTAAAAPVAILSEVVAKRYWKSDPLGAVVRVDAANPASPWATVVGVVGDVRNPTALAVQPTAYRPLAQSDLAGGTLMIRTAGDPMTVAEPVRRELRALVPGTSEFQPASLEKAVYDYVSAQRFTTSVLGGFAILGLLLAAAGVYGVMRHWVTRRIPEIGIRMALGAQPRAVLKLVIARCLVTTAWGLLAGTLGALSLQKWLASQLYGVSPTDPLVVISAVGLMALVGLAAAAGPALSAARMNPLTALKYE